MVEEEGGGERGGFFVGSTAVTRAQLIGAPLPSNAAVTVTT